MSSQPIIISLGGSLIAPKGATTEQQEALITSYAQWLKKLSQANLVVVIVGGGNTARVNIETAKQTNPSISADDLDWIGIKATHANAARLMTVIQSNGGVISHSEIITDPQIKLPYTTGLAIGGGWKPGRSTDYDAVMIASYNSADMVYNMTNVVTVYDKDPKQYPDAKPLNPSITWQELQAVVGTTWSPGLSMPFDPIAAKLALEQGITVKLVGSPTELDNALAGQPFEGTTIHP